MDSKYIAAIAQQLTISSKQVNSVYQLQAEGATVPFMARYRKEATGNLDEVQINSIVEQVKYFTDLQKRKDTIVKTIEAQAKLTSELRAKIEECTDATVLEDIYLPYKPKRKTRASQAIEKGLEPLARLIFQQTNTNPQTEAADFVNEEVKDINAALQGARDIMAEWIAEDETSRADIRRLFQETAILSSRIIASKKELPDAQKYRDYFDYSAPLANCPSHRLLAIRRGEKEELLLMDIKVEKTTAHQLLEKVFILQKTAATEEIKTAIADSVDRLLQPAIENEFRVNSKTTADEEAIAVFADNLRQLLLASPLGSKRVLALDPGFRTGCKLVCLDEQGNLLYNTAIYPHPPQNEWQKSITSLKELVTKYAIDAIGIGNGTAGRETETLVRGIDFGKSMLVFQVNESGASIYSASEAAREEFPDQDITVRGAVSIGRRLLDPLSELVKIDAKSIGVGQYQHDVNQTRLKESLDRVVESCVNHVGVDLNTASKHLLMYVSGLSATLAKNMVDYRAKNGAFGNRNEVKKVPLMGPKTFEQCAGFLRISNAVNPLDNSAVHPETYAVVEAMAKDLQCTVADLVKQPALRRQIDAKKYISETIGAFTIADILKELEKPGRDPRPLIEEFRFDETIKTMEDLKTGMVLPGVVTNITKFGVFVDIGVKQDGMVHISQLSNSYVSDPATVVKLQQKVKVTVTEVDIARKRIALSMKDQQPQSRSAAKPNAPKPAVPNNPFQSKLEELKKKFKD
jgi:protein Tex